MPPRGAARGTAQGMCTCGVQEFPAALDARNGVCGPCRSQSDPNCLHIVSVTQNCSVVVAQSPHPGVVGVGSGRAFTFFNEDKDAHAAHGLCQLLKEAGQPIPKGLAALDDGGAAARRGGAREVKRRAAESSAALQRAKEKVGFYG